MATADHDDELTFVEHRNHLDVYRHALSVGLSDSDYIAIVEELDAQVVLSSGVGFRQTPLVEIDTGFDRPVVGKVETGSVGGSHKARHLFGLLIWLTIDERVGREPPQELAIASCGNAALGAATLAKASGRSLRVFVPADADRAVLDELDRLGSVIEVCERSVGQIGDPCVAELDRAIKAGSEAFTVQGPTSPNVIDGGRTLGLELAKQLGEAGILSGPSRAEDIYIQVGGGALGAATMDGLVRAGVRLRLHPVQPQTAHAYVAMWERIRTRPGIKDVVSRSDPNPMPDERLRGLISANADTMQPWPDPPSSVASGILDDITYDWEPLLYHQLVSGGWPVLASEDDFVNATNLLRDQIYPPPDATGAAGLAGLLADDAAERNRETTAVVLVTGVDRSWAARQTLPQ